MEKGDSIKEGNSLYDYWEMINSLLESNKFDKYKTMLLSFKSWIDDKRFLSDRQKEVIESMFNGLLEQEDREFERQDSFRIYPKSKEDTKQAQLCSFGEIRG